MTLLFLLAHLGAASVDGAAQVPRTRHRPPVAAVGAQTRGRAGTDSLLISATQLRERLTQSKIVVLNIGELAEYKAGHIPGARFLPYEAISTDRRARLMLEIPSPAKLDSLFESLGVSDDSRIVLYWSKDWVSPTTRVFLTLDYLGLGDRTSILDGGFEAWKAIGGPVTAQTMSVSRGSLTVRPRLDVIVDAKTVQASIGKSDVAIIDARDRRFYTGEAHGMQAREGHIPGARNLPFFTLMDDRGTFKSRVELERMLDAAGATADKRVVGYCHMGQQATVVYFAARLLGRDARLYDGSWDEWSRSNDLPVETRKR